MGRDSIQENFSINADKALCGVNIEQLGETTQQERTLKQSLRSDLACFPKTAYIFELKVLVQDG